MITRKANAKAIEHGFMDGLSHINYGDLLVSGLIQRLIIEVKLVERIVNTSFPNYYNVLEQNKSFGDVQ